MYSVDDNPAPGATQRLETVEVDRALTRPSLACAGNMRSLEVVAGCTLGCLFCPVHRRGLPADTIRVPINLPGVLERELQDLRKADRPLPDVLLSPASDPFCRVPGVLALLHEALKLLLEAGAHVTFRTRGWVPEGFAELLTTHAGQVHAEVTLFSMDTDLVSLYEPHAANPQQRLDNIRRLRGWGVEVGARIEPLIPFVSDTAGHLEDLVRHLRSAGIERATTSYLVLRPRVLEALLARVPTAHAHLIKGSFRKQAWLQSGLRQMTKLLPERTRREGYQRLGNIAQRADLQLNVCACQNPTLGSACLQPRRSTAQSGEGRGPGQLDLFGAA